jgi:transglutaminase-like putative cysteine protease
MMLARFRREQRLQDYLASSPVIDWKTPRIQALAVRLRGTLDEPVAITRTLYEWVRDQIPHTVDAGLEPVSCAASEVLALGTGFCYAKSHLLAALLRASGIPAGLCYQRLSLDDRGAPYCLHGFNAVHLPGHGWYRLDPRGNKPGVDAQFAPPQERLAFPARLPGEHSFSTIWAEPLEVVVRALRTHRAREALCRNLPDLEPA